jgi:phage gp45-like
MFDGRLRALEEKLKKYVDERLATMLKIRPYSVTSTDGTTDKVEGYKNDEESYDLDGQRMWPFGIRSRPPQGVDAVWLAVGGRNRSSHGVIVGADSKGYGPGDLQDGEVAIYNKVSGTIIKLDASGGITITAATGQVVNINGSTYSAPQWDDFVGVLKAFTASLKVATTIANVATAATTLDTALDGHGLYKSSRVKWG